MNVYASIMRGLQEALDYQNTTDDRAVGSLPVLDTGSRRFKSSSSDIMEEDLTFEEFKKYYEKYGICKGDSFKRKNKYTEKQLQTRYEKYMKKFNGDEITKEQELRQLIEKRDEKKCQLFKKLDIMERSILYAQGYFIDGNDTDMAHVFNKSSYPWMRYEPQNVVLLSRIFHNRLDEFKHPITGKQITKNEAINWWIKIIGSERYAYLEDLAKNGRNI